MKLKIDLKIAAISAAVALFAVPLAAPISAVHADTNKTAPGEGKVMPDGTPIICKKIPETGSLVKKTKRCYTQAQWDQIAQAARGNATRMQSDHASGLTTN